MKILDKIFEFFKRIFNIQSTKLLSEGKEEKINTDGLSSIQYDDELIELVARYKELKRQLDDEKKIGQELDYRLSVARKQREGA